MWTIICLGKSAAAYGPWPESFAAYEWLHLHTGGKHDLCVNGINLTDHHLQLMYPPECRICGTTLLYDDDNHPADTSLCYRHNDLDAEAEHGLL